MSNIVCRWRLWVTRRNFNNLWVSDFATRNRCSNSFKIMIKSPIKSDLQIHFCLLYYMNCSNGLINFKTNRFLTEDMFSSSRCFFDNLCMGICW